MENRRLRIAMISGSAPPVSCGVGDYTAHLTRALGREDVDASLITTRIASRTVNEAALSGIAWSDPIEHWKWSSFPDLRAAILRTVPDLLHVQYPAQGYDGPLLTRLTQWFRRRLRKPVVVTLHEHIPPHWLVTLMMAQAASAVVSVRPDFQRGFRRLFSWSAATKPFVFIPNAASIPQCNPSPDEKHAIRARLGIPSDRRLIVYFGLVYPRRGVEQLFSIADPDRDHLLIVGGTPPFAQDYGRRIAELSRGDRWRERASLLGFVSDMEAASLLSTSDAVILPFTDGGGIWNTSIHAARLQEVFVLTTSHHESGFDLVRNVFWARPNDVAQMKAALDQYIGVRTPGSSRDVPRWSDIAIQHRQLYESVLAGRSNLLR